MRRSYAVLIACLLVVAGAWLFWPRFADYQSATQQTASLRYGTAAKVSATSTAAGPVSVAAKPATLTTSLLAFRLANTTDSIRRLEKTPHAILLANAFIDTDRPLDLQIPAHLRSSGDPGAYIVQARGPTDARFRAALAAAGAEIVSYIPNNAYLVRFAAGGSTASLAGNSLVQAVLPYEPYYKLQPSLLERAVEQAPLPPGAALEAGLFALGAGATERQLEALGAKIIGRDRSPFGPIVRVLAPTDWIALAQVPGVQVLEVAHSRVLANDLSRPTVGVAMDSQTSSNFLGLTGANVKVAVDDTGVDATHPDFGTRVLGLTAADLVDTSGHGTHVAGTIGGDGTESTTVTAAQGSIMPATNGQFRGMAPAATLFSMNYGNSDYVMQSTAALTNALISNNSWVYGGAFDYDLAAASYDAATRDALPFRTGSQPVLFVFAAGDNGGGQNNGLEGIADTINSPATAKNVITVGALELPRYITNIVTVINPDGTTNSGPIWEPETDSATQVAGFSSRGNVGIGSEGTYGRFKPDVVAPGTFVVSTRSQQWDTNALLNITNVSPIPYNNYLVTTDGPTYFPSVLVPASAVGVIIAITPNQYSPKPFPADLPIYVQQSGYPDPVAAPGSIDFTTHKDGVSIPPDGGAGYLGQIQNNGFYFAVGDSTNITVNFDLTVFILTTNSTGDEAQVLIGMDNNDLGQYYRYESGTSMSAADVSGVLALIQDYFTNTLQLTPSPAMLKAMLINGARPEGGYTISTTNGVNSIGWGLPSLANSLPLTNNTATPVGANPALNSAIFFVDQNPPTALATGDSQTYTVTVNTNGPNLPLRATLVWTDPPGDPNAAIKLVNSLELIITNLDTGQVYYGNNFGLDGYTVTSAATNAVPNFDAINNVQKAIVKGPLAGRYSVTVLGRSVNVNAVTAQNYNSAGQLAPNVVQDFALVVSVGEGEQPDAISSVTDGGVASNPTGFQNTTIVLATNTPLFNQIVGASSPLMGTNTVALGTNTIWGPNGVVTIGQTNQWHFYIVTNTGPTADFTNAAFVTFSALTLSIPRMGVFDTLVDPSGTPDYTRPEADIDLYVTQDPALTNLSPVTIANILAGNAGGFGINNAGASLGQGGTEFVFFTNSAPGQVYYVGVKSEDREAAEYAFLPVFTSTPFSSMDQNGNQVVNGLLLPVQIPDGSPTKPGATNVYALAVMPMVVQKVIVQNLDEHQNYGDLYGTISFSGASVTLNSHDGFGNTYGTAPINYDDSRNRALGTTNTDGPGSLVDFRRKPAIGLWTLTEQDNSPNFTGQVSQLSMTIQPHRDLKEPGVIVAVPPHGWFIDFVDVAAGYTNLTFSATNLMIPPAQPPIEMYEKFGNDPTLTDYDQRADLTNYPPGLNIYPGNSISVGPPLPQGQYYIGLYNPSSVQENVFLRADLGRASLVNNIYNYTSGSGQPLPDDAVTLPVNGGSVIVVPNGTTQQIASVSVGMVVNSPRISDYTFTLISPTGQRVLLMENRGLWDTNGAGMVFVYTNVLNITATGNGAPNTNYLAVDPNGGVVPITYNFYTVPDRMTVYDTTNSALFNASSGYLILDTGFTNNVPAGGGAQNTIPVTVNVPYPPGTTNITIIMNQDGNPYSQGGDAWIYTAGAPVTNYQYLVFTDDTNLATVPIKFAQPPFDFSELSSNYTLSDFSLATNQNYQAPTNIYDLFGGWTMPTNMVVLTTVLTNGQFATVTNTVLLTNNLVSVVTDPSSALTGDAGNSNLLALARGTITRSIATVPGRIYNVTFWYRGPAIAGWWRGEGNATDSSDPEKLSNNGALIGRFTFPAGEVSQAFGFMNYGTTYDFAATNSYVQVPASPSLNVGAAGGFSVEGWINPTNLARPQPLVEWLAHVPTNTAVTNVVIVQGPVLDPATGHFYYLLAATNWTTSETWAQQLGGHLATVETANEQNWIYDTFTAYGTLNRDLWIGYTNNGQGKFFWSSGNTNATYTNWMPGQPGGAAAGDNYTMILGPTNTYPGLWREVGNNRTINRVPPTLLIYGVAEVPNIPTNGVQFWISGTNGTPGYTNVLQGCLYANIVDTNYVSHEIFSAPGLLTNNVYQHVALTFNTNSGEAALYLNGTNVATTNLFANGPFVPKTDGDLLIGWDMTRYTNNDYGGQMDEMSVYSRALSLAEISAIYHVSADTTNRLIGKFDPTVTPAVGLAEALVSFGSTTNVIYGINNQWSQNSYTFTATSNSMPLTISGIEPGILLDAFQVSEAPMTNLYYLPEQALDVFTGDTAAGSWTLQVWDNRVGAFVTNVNSLVSWQLSLVLVSNAVVSATLPPQTPVSSTVGAGQTVYYEVDVPAWAHLATNILVSSSLPVNVFFNATNPPTGLNPGDITLLTGSTGGLPAGETAPVAVNLNSPYGPYQAGQVYYLGVQNPGAHAASVVLEVDYDIYALTNGVPFTGVLTNEYGSLRYFEYDVSSNAYEATFQLLKLSSNADLVVSKGVPLPTLTSSAYGSFNATNADENIYVLTNSTSLPLSAGRWYLGVINRSGGPVIYSVLAKELDGYAPPTMPQVINLANGVPFSYTASPGAALTNFFHFGVTNMVVGGVTNHGLRFEIFNLTGNGDLTVQTNALPLAPPFFQSSQNGGRSSELILIYTNSLVTNLVADWYLGVPSHEITNINYRIIAVLETNLAFPAFPDAQGAGQGAVGAGHAGVNSTVYHVTTTSDAGPGSLRAAVGATNRTVVFDVGGTITLLSPLVINSSYLTIAGQTAPGGITVAGNVTRVWSAHDVVIRDVRFRPGNGSQSGSFLWFSGFEGNGALGIISQPSYFAEGWHVDYGSIKWLDAATGQPFSGSRFIEFSGVSDGISTNLTTVPGATYSLNFAYAQDPDGPNNGVTTVSAQFAQNGNPITTVTLSNPNTSWANLQWATTSVVFTATSPSTQIQISSQNPGAYGLLLDAISLTANPLAITAPSDSLQFLYASNIMVDHVSASWSANNLVTMLNSSNATVQWSIMADSIYNTNGAQGVGSLLRYGAGALSFHHNLYADNYTGSPRLGDNLTLDFVNNVIYNWGVRSGLSGGTNDLTLNAAGGFASGGTNQLNYVCNYLIAGPDTANFAKNNYNITNIAFFGGATNAFAATWIFETNNFMDSDTNRVLNGANTDWAMFTNQFTRFNRGFPLPPVSVDEAFLAYEKVLDFAGVSLSQRDAVDTNIVTNVRYQTGRLISTSPSAPASSMVAWWKAENNALDSVGTNHGTLTNGVTYANGKVGRTFSLPGVANPLSTHTTYGPGPEVVVPYNSFWALTNNFTIELWANFNVVPNSYGRPSGYPYEGVFISDDQGGGGLNKWWFALDDGKLDFHINGPTINGGAGVFLVQKLFTPATNVWYHFAITRNGNLYTIYTNGVTIGSQTDTTVIPNPAVPLTIGGGESFYFNGLLDEVTIYNRALASNEVAAIYNAGSAGKTTSTTSTYTPTYLDTDQDGIPDFWEITFGTDPFTPSQNNDRNGDGYTDLEEYDNWLAVPHAATITNTPVTIDLYQICGASGRLAFFVTNNFNGSVYLTNVSGAFTNSGVYSNRFAVFMPANSGSTNFYGYAGFGLVVSNVDTSAYFGPVPVSVVVSSVAIAMTPQPTIIELTSGVPYTNSCNSGGSDFYHIAVTTNDFGAVFELDNRTGPMALALRYGLPLPSLSSYDYYTNAPAPPATEQIVVLTNTATVPLAPGDWYMAAVNVNPAYGACVSYSAKISKLSNLLPPQFLFPTNATVTNLLETVPAAISCVATDLDTPPLPLTYAVVSGPVGLIVSNGVIYWTPTEAQGPSTNAVQISVSNGAFAVTNSFTINVLESNLPPVLPAIPNQAALVSATLVVTNTATDPDLPVNPLTYALLTAPANAAIDINGVITWTPTPANIGSNYLFTTVVTDTNPWAVNAQSLSATNSFYVTVLPGLPPNQPGTNVVAANSINWFDILVPTNADMATNILRFATAPVNLWFSTNVPPSITNAADVKLLANSTGGSSILVTNAAPFLVPGGRYFLGVQNTNSFSVTNAVEVDFELVNSTFTFSIFSITPTNLAGVNGYLLTWFAPPGAQFKLQWTPTLTPPNWHNFNGVISAVGLRSAGVGLFQYFDDGSQSGPFGPTHFYRLQLLNSPANTPPFFLNNPADFDVSPLVPFAYTNSAKDWDVPPQILTYTLTNSLSGTNLAVVDSFSGVITWTPNNSQIGQTNILTTVVTDSGTPPMSATNSFAVVVNPTPSFGSITIVTNGVRFQWTAPTNEQFQIRWTTNLAPPSWTLFPNVITSATTNFSFVDTNTPLWLMKFYQLILLP